MLLPSGAVRGRPHRNKQRRATLRDASNDIVMAMVGGPSSGVHNGAGPLLNQLGGNALTTQRALHEFGQYNWAAALTRRSELYLDLKNQGRLERCAATYG